MAESLEEAARSNEEPEVADTSVVEGLSVLEAPSETEVADALTEAGVALYPVDAGSVLSELVDAVVLVEDDASELELELLEVDPSVLGCNDSLKTTVWLEDDDEAALEPAEVPAEDSTAPMFKY